MLGWRYKLTNDEVFSTAHENRRSQSIWKGKWPSRWGRYLYKINLQSEWLKGYTNYNRPDGKQATFGTVFI